MRDPRRLPLAAFALLGLGVPALGKGEAPAPQYRLEAGQEIHYRGAGEFKSEGDAPPNSFGSREERTLWVVRADDGHGWRVIMKMSTTATQDGKPRGEPVVALALFDLASGGTIGPNDSFGDILDPTMLLPRLPKDADEAARGWEDVRKGWPVFTAEGTSRFRLVPEGKPGGLFVFDETRAMPFEAIHQYTSGNRFTFDPRRGLIVRVDGHRNWTASGASTDRLELAAIETRDPGWMATLEAEADLLFAAKRRHGELVEHARKEPVGAEAMESSRPPSAADSPRLIQARETLVKARDASTIPMIRDALESEIRHHDRMASFYRKGAIERARVLGKPAADWETKDLEGKPHALKDYRGKVVVLDFWYRGCGWCIRAMPQINQLADDFKGAPVAFLGMNTDPKEEDAKFVVGAMALKYPVLKAEGLPEKYAVNGFPTLILIGPDGVVRDLHYGYTPTLREDVGKAIRELLPPK